MGYDRSAMSRIKPLFLALCLAATAVAQPEQPQHQRPFSRFSGAHNVLQQRLSHIQIEGYEQKVEKYQSQTFEKRLHARWYDMGLTAAVGLWQATQDEQYKAMAIDALLPTLDGWLSKSDEELIAPINDEGSSVDANFDARDACYHFALHYYLTEEKQSARKAALLLARFAESIPKWPIWFPYYVEKGETKKRLSRDGAKTFESEYSAGLWGNWIYFDLMLVAPLMHAYDLIHPSEFIQEMEVEESVLQMFELHMQCQKKYNPNSDFSNMEAARIRGYFVYGELMAQPEVCHEAVYWLRSLFKTSFYADGWWHEGSPSYHWDLIYGLKDVADTAMYGYSDPPGFTSKMDRSRFDHLDMRKDLARQFARADHVINGVVQPNGLVQVIGDTAFPQKAWWAPPMEQAKSHLFGAMGHAILGVGSGEDMVQATLHFGGTHGHSHQDTLGIIYFAKGREVISETQYHPGKATNSTREWHTVTPGHVTVLVDEQSQRHYGQLGKMAREKQPADRIRDIPDWRWRWRGHGNHLDDGKLRLFNTEFENVQVVEADGKRAYSALVNMQMYRRTLALVKIDERDTYLVDIFRVRGGTTHDYMLHSCLEIPYQLKTSVRVDRKKAGTMYSYLTNLQTGQTDREWSATFSLDDGSTHLTTFFAAMPEARIIRSEGPSMRRLGVSPFLTVRHRGEESVFVAVHHPHTEKPLVKSVELLSSRIDRVIVRINLVDRTDLLASTPTRFQHHGGKRWRYAIGGNNTHRGEIQRTYRIEAGQQIDAFVTDAPLPTDGSLDGLTLIIDLGGVLTQAFRIDHIEREKGQSIIVTQDEPGMTITPSIPGSPGLIKLEYYPNWGIAGTARFRINGSAVSGS